jgi:iron complex transport system permease protein
MSHSMPRIYLLAVAALCVGVVLSLFLGLDADQARMILVELRLPRLLLAMAVGGALAVSGLVLQAVLGNPLADPYTLGVASGAALGAALGSSWGVLGEVISLESGATLGAGGSILLLLGGFRRGGRNGESMILAGVMLSLLLAGLLSLWMVIAEPAGVRVIQFWLLGDLGRATYRSAVPVLVLGVASVACLLSISKKLDAFLFGEDEVEGFGVSLGRTRKGLILGVSVLVGFCVSSAGMIGFVGLAIPHFLRRLTRTSLHFHLLPLSWIFGAAVLSAGDALARDIASPKELPVGAVMVLVGVPVFLWIHARARRGGES